MRTLRNPMSFTGVRFRPFFFILLLSVLIPISSYAQGTAKNKVLVVHSYHESQKGHVVAMTQGIIEALNECRPEIRFFHMDTKRKNNLEWKITAGKKASELMSQYNPDLVIAMDDNAQEYFVKHHAGKKKRPFFVFGGVNAEPEKYGFPAENVTGVIERPNIGESIDLLLKIAPEVKKIVLISDKSATTDPFHEYAATLDLPVEIIASLQPETVSEWKRVIEKYKDVADAFGVYVIRTIKDTRTNKMAGEIELMAYLNEQVKKPTVGFFDTAGQSGALCGISVSMMEQGYASAAIACEILQGKKPADFEIRPTSRGKIFLNLVTAEKLGLDIRYSIIKNANEVIKN